MKTWLGVSPQTEIAASFELLFFFSMLQKADIQKCVFLHTLSESWVQSLSTEALEDGLFGIM